MKDKKRIGLLLVMIGVMIFLLRTLISFGSIIEEDVVEKGLNKYVVRGTIISANGEKVQKFNGKTITSYYKDGILKKVVEVDDKTKELLSERNYDDYGLADGKEVAGDLKRYYTHGFLDGKSEMVKEGVVKNYKLGVLDGKVDHNLKDRGHRYSMGVLVDDSKIKVEDIDIRPYLKKIILGFQGKEEVPSGFTGAYYGLPRGNGWITRVTLYDKGTLKGKVSFDNTGYMLDKKIYNKEGKIVEESSYTRGLLDKKKIIGDDGFLKRDITSINKDYKGTTFINDYLDGFPNGKRYNLLRREGKDGSIELENEIGYSRVGVFYDGDGKKYVFSILEGEENKREVDERELSRIVIDDASKVDDLSKYTGYVKKEYIDKEMGIKKATLERYAEGRRSEILSYNKVEDNYYILQWRKEFLPSGDIIKYINYSGRKGYIKKSPNSSEVEFLISVDQNRFRPEDEYDGRWIGKMKDGKFIGRIIYKEKDKVGEESTFTEDGNSYSGVGYNDEGKVNLTSKGKRNKDGVLIGIGDMISYDNNGKKEMEIRFGEELTSTKEVETVIYKDEKEMFRQKQTIDFRLSSRSLYNYIGRVEETISDLVGEF